ncbi:MAG TPA: VOC family protein [Rickettsiales bacterium]|nr:VOC family protein [Rickettsiales bacterium]
MRETASNITTAIDHVNIVVGDIEAMAAFYRDVIGLELYKDAFIEGDWVDDVVGLQQVRAKVVFLRGFTGSNLELIQYLNPVGETPQNIGISNSRGIRHIAFRVADVSAMVERCKEKGIKTSPVHDVPIAQVKFDSSAKRKRICYLHDPEGNLLEFCAYE